MLGCQVTNSRALNFFVQNTCGLILINLHYLMLIINFCIYLQMESLLNIVRDIASIKTYNYSSLEFLSSYLEDLNAVIDTRKVDALVVETFGRRIAKLLQ